MLNEIIYEIIKLRWVAIVTVCLILILSGVFWFFSRKFAFDKKLVNVFAPLYKIDKKQIICIALMVGRFFFVLTSSIFCIDINFGHLIILILFTVMIFAIGRNVKMFITSLLNYIGLFFLIFIESTLLNYFNEIEKMWIIIVMAVMIGFFAVLDSLLTSINSYNSIIKKETVILVENETDNADVVQTPVKKDVIDAEA